MTKQDKNYSDLIQHPIKNVNDYIPTQQYNFINSNDAIVYDESDIKFINRKIELYNCIGELQLKLCERDKITFSEATEFESTLNNYFNKYENSLNKKFKDVIIEKNSDLNDSLGRSDLINFNDHFNALLYIENYTYESEQDEFDKDEIEDILEYFKFKQDTINKIYYYLNLNNI